MVITMQDYQHPSPKRSYDELLELVRNQIQFGVPIEHARIRTEEDLHREEEARKKFDEYTETFLKTSFNDLYFWEQISDRITDIDDLLGTSLDSYAIDYILPLEQRINKFRKSMRDRIESLRSIMFQLPLLYPNINITSEKGPSESSIPRKGFVFVAMHMDDENSELTDTLNTIKRAAKEFYLDAQRIDDDQSNKKLIPRVLKHLASAEYVVADLTFERPSVYLEAGYAIAYGNDPIFIAKIGTTIHFDTKDYPIIFFESDTELEDKLKKRLEALVKKN